MKHFFSYLSLMSGAILLSSQIALADETNYTVCKVLPSNYSVVYQPGIDVHGNPVAPADIDTNMIAESLNVIKMPLTIDMGQKITALTQGAVKLEAPMGMIDVHQNGTVLYNGQDITKPVSTLCGKSFKEVSTTLVESPQTAPEEEVQNSPDNLKEIIPQQEEPEVEPLMNALAVDSPEEASEMPAVSVPIVEADQNLETIHQYSVSVPDKPLEPLSGTTKSINTQRPSDILTGEDYRSYHE